VDTSRSSAGAIGTVIIDPTLLSSFTSHSFFCRFVSVATLNHPPLFLGGHSCTTLCRFMFVATTLLEMRNEAIFTGRDLRVLLSKSTSRSSASAVGTENLDPIPLSFIMRTSSDKNAR